MENAVENGTEKEDRGMAVIAYLFTYFTGMFTGASAGLALGWALWT